MDAKKLIQDAQALVTPHQLDEFFAYLADDETIRSVRCDLLAETALIEVRALDPIVTLFDYEGCLFHWESPFGELKPQFGEFGSPQRRALAKIAQLHAREKVRAEHGLPPLSEFERERWLVRPPRPFLPTDPPRYTFPMPHPPQVYKLSLDR